jgi:UDP-N-acetylglucosamine--N-acetylmuramyl-(pentapeptide) pyrophosphoryl-undecaprenol N-acetylglucosamine transferase
MFPTPLYICGQVAKKRRGPVDVEIEKKKIIFAAGGTGGHLFPALAVAKEMANREAVEVAFFCRDNQAEIERIERDGFEAIGLPILGLRRKPGLHWLTTLRSVWSSLRKAKQEIMIQQPELIIGFGGYASFPAVRTAGRLGIPYALHEQNAWPGIVNRRYGQGAAEIWCSDMTAAETMGWRQAVHTGYPMYWPVDESIKEQPAPWPLEINLPTLLVYGGSQGSLCINRLMAEVLPELRKRCQFNAIIQTGEKTFAAFEQKLSGERTVVLPFIEEMDSALAHCDLVVARAGAGSLAEITSWGRAALLIPLAIAAGGHQEKNAQTMVRAGAAKMRLESELDTVRIADWMETMLTNTDMRQAMARRSRDLGRVHRNAVSNITDRALALIEGKVN